MTNNDIFIDRMDKANAIAQSAGYVNAIAWAKKACENQIITQYDYKNFEKLHNFRNLMAHGGACDIQISDNTLTMVYAFCKAVAQLDVTTLGHQESYLLKEEKQKQKRTYVGDGDFVFVQREDRLPWNRDARISNDDRGYHLYVVSTFQDALDEFLGCNKMHLNPVDTYGEVHPHCDIDPGEIAFVVPKKKMPTEVALVNDPTAWNITLVRDKNGGYKNNEIQFFFTEGNYRINDYDRREFEVVRVEGYVATPECFHGERLAFEDVELTEDIKRVLSENYNQLSRKEK